jgi:hypothetical protein
MPGEEDSHTRSGQTIAPFRWCGSRILEEVWQVNEHLVSALTELARHESASIGIVRQNANTLRHFDAAACNRAARVPVLLVDLNFRNEDWWGHAASVSADCREPTAPAFSLSAAYSAELTRESLIVAWLAVQHSRESARLLFGMSAPVAKLLGGLTPRQINGVAAGASQELRIRWQSSPAFWRKLFLAGRSGSPVELCEVQLLGLQLLGGDLLGER